MAWSINFGGTQCKCVHTNIWAHSRYACLSCQLPAWNSNSNSESRKCIFHRVYRLIIAQVRGTFVIVNGNLICKYLKMVLRIWKLQFLKGQIELQTRRWICNPCSWKWPSHQQMRGQAQEQVLSLKQSLKALQMQRCQMSNRFKSGLYQILYKTVEHKKILKIVERFETRAHH